MAPPSAGIASATGPAGAEGAYLEIAGVAKRFRQATVLEDVSLMVGRGELVSLLGPSGCGKTTLLRVLAGLLAPDRGRVRLGGRDLGSLPPHRRNVGVVFQSYALFPHMTVAGNVAFGLRARRRPRASVAPRVAELLELVQLSHLADRPVSLLSGGQQQRVAIARALAPGPDLLLLDEPLSALDRKLRETMQVELRGLLRRLGMTAVFVTHDQEEALALSDRVAVMNGGRIEQLASPRAIYDRPATPFVLDFVGQATVLHGHVVQENPATVLVRTAHGVVEAPGRLAQGASAMVAVRPERISVAASPAPGSPPSGGAGPAAGWTGIALPVAERTFLGSRCLLHGAVRAPDRATVELPASAAMAAALDGVALVGATLGGTARGGAPTDMPSTNMAPADAAPGTEVAIAWRVSDGLLFPTGVPACVPANVPAGGAR